MEGFDLRSAGGVALEDGIEVEESHGFQSYVLDEVVVPGGVSCSTAESHSFESRVSQSDEERRRKSQGFKSIVCPKEKRIDYSPSGL